jgi:xylulokinase
VSCYLGIDIGTFGSKGVLVDATGTVLALAHRAHRMAVPRPGWAEHDPERIWWAEYCSLSRELIAAAGVPPSRIRAVGASGIGPCMLAVDEAGAPLMDAVLYSVDTRAAREIAELTEEIGPAELVRTGGNALSTQSVGPKILWLRRHRPDIFARTRYVLNSSSFLVHRLTGRFVLDHYTGCNSGPLYDLAEGRWTDRHAERIIAADRLPELRWSTDVVGGVTAEAAAATGLRAGTPVIAGTTDAAAEAVSVGVQRPGELMVMYGSSLFMILVTGERVIDPRLAYGPWLFEGEHSLAASASTSGTVTHWFADQLARELDPGAALTLLADEAAGSEPGARGILVLPHFSGERTPIHDPYARGAIVGLDLTHTRSDLYRALLEGLAYSARWIADTYAAAGAQVQRVTAIGGGTRNRVWLQSTSDAVGWTQYLRTTTIGAAYGDAFLAAVGVGDARREDIDAWNPPSGRVPPDPEVRPVHDRRFADFVTLYERARGLGGAA